MPNFKFNVDFVPVPNDFIEHIMPTANPSYVMVYLYVMLMATTNKSADNAAIAKRLGLIESDVVNAIKFWNKKGVFSGTGDTIIIKHSVDEEISHDSIKKPIDEVSQLIEGNGALSDLCAIAQEILGKTLANNDLETLYWFYDQLGFSPEVITMLLEYCVSIDKRNMKYIEKVAISWHENNIKTIDEAQAYITRNEKSDSYVYSLRQLFGILDRALTKSETVYISSWRDELEMSADMVGLAYEYSIMAINKLSFPYINTILKRWAEQGIRTIPEAEADHNGHKQNANSGNNGTEMTATADIDQLEKAFMDSYQNN